MPRFVVGLLGETTRQVGVVAILVELAFGLREQVLSARQGLRGVTGHAQLLGLSEQRSGLAQILGLDRRELGVSVEALGFLPASARASNIAGFEPARGAVESLLRLAPEIRRERLGVGVRRVIARFYQGSERHARRLGRFRGLAEQLDRGREIRPDALDAATPREVRIGGVVQLHRSAEGIRRKQLRIGLTRRGEARVGFAEQRAAQVLGTRVLDTRVLSTGALHGQKAQAQQ